MPVSRLSIRSQIQNSQMNFPYFLASSSTPLSMPLICQITAFVILSLSHVWAFSYSISSFRNIHFNMVFQGKFISCLILNISIIWFLNLPESRQIDPVVCSPKFLLYPIHIFTNIFIPSQSNYGFTRIPYKIA